MNITIAQLNPTIGDLRGNAQHILEAAQAVTQNACQITKQVTEKKAEQVTEKQARLAQHSPSQLLLTPELSICGYPPRDLLLDPSFITAAYQVVEELAQQLPPELAVLVGMPTRNPYADRDGGKALFNSIVLLQAGAIAQVFHKRLLPTYDVFDEHRYFEPNPAPTAASNVFFWVTTPEPDQPSISLKIGVTICEDLWNDEAFWGKRSYGCNPIADLAAAEVDLIVNLSASPYTLRKQHVREAMLQAAATRYQLPIIYVNQVGGNDDLIFDGNSVAVDRTGQIIARAAHCATDCLDIKLSLGLEDSAAVKFEPRSGITSPPPAPLSPTVTQNRPIVNLNPGTIAPYPTEDTAEIWSVLVLGVRDYAQKCGFKQAVLGLSGGIDSSLVAAIAVEALGAENVFGVLMSSPYTSQASVDDAIALAQNLQIRTEQLPIAPMMQGFDSTLADLFHGTTAGIAEENLQSRIRGTLLMAIANKFGYLLLSTGNKSEMAVGYCTLYGDMNGGLAVIADVPKTRVYELCSWLNVRSQAQRQQDVIPRNVLEKPPSAELRPDQRDSDSLPDYDTLDEILDRLIHQHQSAAQIIAAGFEATTVERVTKLVTRAEFKRRQAAPGLKITDRAFGTGWRMPIAAQRSI